MTGQETIVSFFLHGTLSANHTFTWTVPAPGFHVKEVSEKASNDSDATTTLGISSDTDSILASAVIGDSDTPSVKTRSDFASTNPDGELNENDVMVWSIDHDGVSGTAAANVSVVITLLPGS